MNDQTGDQEIDQIENLSEEEELQNIYFRLSSQSKTGVVWQTTESTAKSNFPYFEHNWKSFTNDDYRNDEKKIVFSTKFLLTLFTMKMNQSEMKKNQNIIDHLETKFDLFVHESDSLLMHQKYLDGQWGGENLKIPLPRIPIENLDSLRIASVSLILIDPLKNAYVFDRSLHLKQPRYNKAESFFVQPGQTMLIRGYPDSTTITPYVASSYSISLTASYIGYYYHYDVISQIAFIIQ